MTEATAGERPGSYSGLHKWIHWITAACILGLIPLGIALDKLPQGDLQNRAYNLHRSFGILVLTLAVLRVAVRVARGTPPPYANLTKFERIASASVHHLLYVLIFFMPLVGWMMVSAYRVDEVPIFGLFNLPHFIPQSDAAYKVFKVLHFVGGILLTLCVLAHIGGALMHGLIKRDGVLPRMLPKGWGRIIGLRD